MHYIDAWKYGSKGEHTEKVMDKILRSCWARLEASAWGTFCVVFCQLIIDYRIKQVCEIRADAHPHEEENEDK